MHTVIYCVHIRLWPSLKIYCSRRPASCCLRPRHACLTIRVGQNHTFIGIYGVYTVFLAGKSPYIRSYTVCIYGSGQPY